MWGSAKADPPQQEESEDLNLTHDQRMAKYPKPMVAFDRDGVLFETDGTPIKREDAVPIVDAFKAIAMIRRKGHKIAMIDLKEGDTILKYGHDIGKVVKSIKKGEHVHVHNVKTKKW